MASVQNNPIDLTRDEIIPIFTIGGGYHPGEGVARASSDNRVKVIDLTSDDAPCSSSSIDLDQPRVGILAEVTELANNDREARRNDLYGNDLQIRIIANKYRRDIYIEEIGIYAIQVEINDLIRVYLPREHQRPIYHQSIRPQWLKNYLQAFRTGDGEIMRNHPIGRGLPQICLGAGIVKCSIICDLYFCSGMADLRGIDAVVLWRLGFYAKYGCGKEAEALWVKLESIKKSYEEG